MMFPPPPRKLFSKSLNASLAALLLAAAAPVWADNTTQFKQALTAYQADNYEQAFHLWQSLAQQGDAEAQFNLGVMYSNGQGVTQDYRQAMAWYQKAANQGHAIAQYNLAVMYANGRGVAQDYRQAKALLQKILAQPDTPDNAEAKANARISLASLIIMGIR